MTQVKKPTARERYTEYFWDELRAHPGVPPNRTRIAERMGWKTSNHGGEMPQVRRDLMDQAGFTRVNGRYRKRDLPVDRSLGAVEAWLRG